MKKVSILLSAAAALLLSACGDNSPVGTVDVQRIVANWDKYQSFSNQLQADEQKIFASKASTADKQHQAQALQAKYAKITDDLTQEIRTAAQNVATDRKLKLVVTREGVGYGGVDITPDVEKSLNITEKPTSSPAAGATSSP